MQINREQLLKDLKNDIIDIHFTKLDGTLRVLKGTLYPVYLPENYKVEDQEEFHKNNNEVIRCYDVVANGWRSFRADSVQYIQIATP